MNKTLLNKARLNAVSLNKALINGAVERHGSSAGGGGAPSKYIRFADPAVEAVLMANGVSSDGVGITKEDAAAVTSIGTWFKGNTVITSFDEFEYFTGVTFLGTSTNQTSGGAFNGCTSLVSIKMPSSVVELRPGAFHNCTSLRSAGDLSHIKTFSIYSFANTSLEGEISLASAEGEIGYGAFAKSKITRIISLGNATAIGGSTQSTTGAFAECSQLQFVELPATLLEIRNWAFYNCTSLSFEELNLPNLTTLGQNAFYGVKIKKLSLGALTSLPSASSSTQNYGDKSVLEEVVIPEGVTSIPNYSFNGYAALTSIKFQNTITLGEYAFRNCTALSDVDWDKIAEIGYGAFNVCTSLPSEVSIPNMTGGIAQNAFAGCTSIIRFSASATSIGVAAFTNCKIEEATLLNAVSLAAAAFNRNYQLKVVRMRDVTTFTGDVFYACSKLEAVIVDNTTPPSLSSNAFQVASSTFIIYVPDAALEVYKTATNWSAYADRIHPLSELEGSPYITFADAEVERVLMENNVSSDGVGITMADAQAVTSIGTWFYNNTAITNFEEFKFFKGVTSLEYRAFHGCTSLQEIALPTGCTALADGSANYGSFRDCSSLQKVVANGLTSLGYGAFQNCSTLSDLRITWENVTKINNQALRDCTALSFEFLNLLSLETLGTNALNGVKVKKLNLGKVTVLPTAAATSLNYGDKSVLEEVVIPEGVTSIPAYSFYNYSHLEEIIVRAVTPPELVNTNALAKTNNCPIYVPDASVDAYKAAANWSTYADRIRPLSEYVES